MREHKYQVWHKEHKQMYMLAGYDHIVDYDDYTEPEREYSEQIQHVLYTPDLPGCEKIWRADAAYVEIREYTGLKDRTGKDIYEGDIILRHAQWGNGSPEAVTYENGHWSYSYDLVEYCERPDEQWEIIGNLYETPDLMKTMEKELPE